VHGTTLKFYNRNLNPEQQRAVDIIVKYPPWGGCPYVVMVRSHAAVRLVYRTDSLVSVAIFCRPSWDGQDHSGGGGD